VLLIALTVLAGLLRLEGITHPSALVFDEFYASDACLYVLGPQPQCSTLTEISIVHPPLGKWLIGAGIRVFGFTPAGWRVAPLIAGTLSVAVLYLLGRRLLGSTVAASLAAGLLAFDLLHFLMSRTAMLDAFVVFFGVTAFLCIVYDSTREPAGAPDHDTWLSRLVARRWLIAAGVAGGAAVASKWSGAYLLLTVLLLALLDGASRVREVGPSNWRAVRSEAVPLIVALIFIPLAVYIASFVGRVQGSALAWPWTTGAWVHALFERHQIAMEHHTGSLYTHPYMSPPWSWPLLKRPVLFYFREVDGGHYQEILALGNPLVWWLALISLGIVAWRIVRQPHLRASHIVIVAGFLAGYLPWFIITRRESFLYYSLPAVPFLCLALAQVTVTIRSRSVRALAITGLVIASAGGFLFFRPVLTASPLSYPAWQRRILFHDCGPALPGAREMPVTRPIPPPTGWCWL
jgi:dolichyl-phosphate-mannose-protein mannosyltransferase